MNQLKRHLSIYNIDKPGQWNGGYLEGCGLIFQIEWLKSLLDEMLSKQRDEWTIWKSLGRASQKRNRKCKGPEVGSACHVEGTQEVMWLDQSELVGEESEGLQGPDQEGPWSQNGGWLLFWQKGKPLEFLSRGHKRLVYDELIFKNLTLSYLENIMEEGEH